MLWFFECVEKPNHGRFYLYIIEIYNLISVRSWNFKDGGSLKASFLAKNQHATKEKSLKNSYE